MDRSKWLVCNAFYLGVSFSSAPHSPYTSTQQNIFNLFSANGSLNSVNSEH
ncbi:hypothetical protein ACPUEJ_06270 [Vibrio tubiashii]|uniref:hypothetical protein n=1 Tax=Vibrio tubiashii TaxID=29498 RepID=UPI003CE4FED1